MNLTDFLERNRISPEIWDRSQCNWSELKAIAEDHNTNQGRLLQSADFFAKLIQKFDCVHSVRWRVKDTEHLLAKIIRKRAEGVEKYLALKADNYHENVTDLIGIRALHLFKDDCLVIDKQLRETWKTIEVPIAYVRLGDDQDLTQKFKDDAFKIKEHPAGYRSVHYVFESQPTERRVITEVQVRTIFEEGWSEIDHQVRYPNLSDVPQVNYFLTIFNRMAGSADEMGGFVRALSKTLREQERQIQEATGERERTLVAMDKALAEMEKLKEQDQTSQKHVAVLKAELEKLRNSSTSQSIEAEIARLGGKHSAQKTLSEFVARARAVG